MDKITKDTDKLQVTFIPGRGDTPGKIFFWFPPKYDKYPVEQVLYQFTDSVSHFSFQNEKFPLVLPASWVLKRKPRSNTPRVFNVQGKALSIVDSLIFLSAISEDGSSPLFHKKPSSSLKVWTLAAKFSLELIIRGQIIPTLKPISGNFFKAVWKVSLWMDSDRKRFLKLAKAMPLACYAALCRDGKEKKSSPAIYPPEFLLQQFLDEAADCFVRYSFKSKKKDVLFRAFDDDDWQVRFISSLIGQNSTFCLKGFNERYIPQLLDKWLKPVLAFHSWRDYRVCLKLEMPPDDGKDIDSKWRISYLLQAMDDPSLLVPAEEVWRSSKEELKFLNRSFKKPQERLLMALADASNIFPPLTRSLRTARPSCVTLDTKEVWEFISEAAIILQQSGFGILVPQELTRAGQRRIKLKMKVGSGRSDVKIGGGSGMFNLSSLVDYKWEIALGDDKLSISDFRQIAKLKQPIVRWKDRWIMVDPEEINQIEKLLTRKDSGKLTLQQALFSALIGERKHPEIKTPVEVVAAGDFKSIVDTLKDGKLLKPVQPPPTFQGKLRAYQKRGLMWIAGMTGFGFGICLADDMGLGKTVQVIAWLLYRKYLTPDDQHPVLVICPTSVLGNWQKEIERFAPDLPVVRHYGLNRDTSKKSLEEKFSPHTVVLTTYSLAVRDRDLLSQIEWGAVILDEAQNIKNPFSQRAKATRRLKARARIALTGTPVENRLSELWSIFEFLNPGFLGPLKRFRQEFAIPVERYRDPEATAKLKKLSGPFLLRRLKTDKSVIADLPEKNEMKVFCTLTREQATLYQALIDETMKKIEKSEGMKRRGLVLSLITSLKQICNHPSLYLREGRAYPNRSGKLKRLTEMIEELIEERHFALLFTQFREMGYLLVRYFEEKFGVRIPFLHGGIPGKKRDEMVRSFQEDEDAPPLLLVSLRAGGTGLNLTRASFVFHFDRWWNPAVENQATDRTFRIGQKKNVQVYKFICIGTLEEKIDRMLEEKLDLANKVIGTGESWLTEMSSDELREILSLSSDVTVEQEV